MSNLEISQNVHPENPEFVASQKYRKYRELLKETWAGFLIPEQAVLRFTEDPEGYNVKILSDRERDDFCSQDNTWAPTVLLHLESYVKLSEYLRGKGLLEEGEVLDPLPWLFNDKNLAFFQEDKNETIGLVLDFDFDFYSDTPYFEQLLGRKISELNEKQKSIVGRFLRFIKFLGTDE